MPSRPRRVPRLHRVRGAIARPWRIWLADNLLRGVPPAELQATLIKHEVPPQVAARGLRAAARSPELEAARKRLGAAGRQALASRLRRELLALRGPAIDRRPLLAPEVFLRDYYATGTPLVVTDLVIRWPAFTLWTPEHLRERYGAVEIEIEAGRASDPAPDMHFERHRQSSTMAAYVDRVLAAGQSNDLYLIANNRNLARPGLRGLLADIDLPVGYFGASVERAARNGALWFGPAGTVTALHHDTSNILLCQVRGHKRLRLFPPDEPRLLSAAHGVYNELDPERDTAILAGRGLDLVLAPGEALFLPVGWWHHVRALDLSISVAFNHFVWLNEFEWYKPGTLG